MRRAVCLLMCSTLLLPARPAMAQTRSTIPAAPVCSQPRYIKPADLMGIAGLYDLSNGDFLDVSRESRRFFAEMGKLGRMEIVPLNDKEFVEKGGTVRFTFDRDLPWSDVVVAGLDVPRDGIDRCRHR